MRRFIVGTTAVATILGGVALASHATAAPLSCNQTVTSSVTLTQDYTCSSSGFLKVGAPNVTINFAGHKVHGLGANFTAIDLQGNAFSKVVGGTIEGFRQDGIDGSGTTGAVIQNMTIQNIGDSAVEMGSARYSKVMTNNISNADTAINACGGDHNAMTGNTMTGNNVGLFFGWQTLGAVTGNKGVQNDVSFLFMGDDSGSLLSGNSDLGSRVGFNSLKSGNSNTTINQAGTVVQNSKAIGSYIGYLDGCDDLRFLNPQSQATVHTALSLFSLSPGPWPNAWKKNVATANSYGYYLNGTFLSRVLDSTITSVVTHGVGIYLLDDSYTRVMRNVVKSSAAYVTGVFLDNSANDTVALNSSTNKGLQGVGILLDNGAADNQVGQNATNANGLTGIVVAAAAGLSNYLTFNQSNNNGSYGYDIVESNLVGGTLPSSNTALGNLTQDFNLI